jgi:hypothetical protein
MSITVLEAPNGTWDIKWTLGLKFWPAGYCAWTPEAASEMAKLKANFRNMTASLSGRGRDEGFKLRRWAEIRQGIFLS